MVRRGAVGVEPPQPLGTQRTHLALCASRIAWWVMAVGPLVWCLFMVVWPGVDGFIGGLGGGDRDAVVAFSVSLIPLGGFVRSQLYKRCWRVHQILPVGYFLGNVFFWACCGLVAVLGLTHLARSPWLALALMGVAVAVQLASYPDGAAMRPTPPVFGAGDRGGFGGGRSNGTPSVGR